MHIDEAESSLRQHLISAGLRLEQADAAMVIAAMTEWYATVRAADAAPVEEDGDMLLFQWGMHDWGTGPVFEYGLTRQLIRADDEHDEGIIQLAVTYRYPVSDQITAVEPGHRWCASPANLEDFRREIEAHPASHAIRALEPRDVVVTCEVAG